MKTFRQIIQYDKLLGHRYVPNLFTRMRYGNDGYFLETDNHGFRNSPTELSGEKKIIFLGDSFTAGDGVSNADRFSDLIRNDLNCEVVNIGVSGYGADQQILAYEEISTKIDHDVIVFAPHLDDLKRNLMSSREGINKSSGNGALIPKPYFELAKEVLLLKNVPVPLERKNIESNKNENSDFSFYRRAINFINRKLFNKQLHPELSDSNSQEWQLMHKIIERFVESAKGKQVIIAPLPYYDSVTYKELPSYLSVFKIHESKNVHIVDVVTSINNNYSLENDELFLPLCGHFTVKGHQIVAETISKKLLELQIVSARNQPKIKNISNSDVYVLGLSCFYHDSAAAILKNGEIIAAAQEERFTRIKHDKGFPLNAINYCLEFAQTPIDSINAVVYYDIETWTIERVLHNSMAIGSKGEALWNEARKSLYSKLRLPKIIRKNINFKGEIFKTQHHISHAAGAYFSSPFDDAAILVIDGVGEWACSTIAEGNKNKITIKQQQLYPHSLGLLYSAFTYFCGFKVNSGEYKLMGLAPYGEPVYVPLIKKHIVDIKEDGSIFLNMDYFSFLEGKKMTNSKFADLFDGPERSGESEITRREMNLAASIQSVAEEIVIKMANNAYKITGKKYLVMSGGVALNCVSNGKLFKETPFLDFFFQPASGDAGGAIGCALNWFYENYPHVPKSSQPNPYLGPCFSNSEIIAFLETKGLNYHKFEDESRASKLSKMLAENNIVGHFDGRMEFGPRALGNRSIIANPLNVEMQSKLNLKIKYRESFRPFAPIYAEERTSEYFDFDRPSPYMLVVRNVVDNLLVKNKTEVAESDNLIELINLRRSDLPAITHIDNSARLQSVNEKQNKRFHGTLIEFEKITGKAVLINTSFNVRGEPIVCTINDAYRCFMRTEMDILVLNDFYLLKSEQPKWEENENWRETFELD